MPPLTPNDVQVLMQSSTIRILGLDADTAKFEKVRVGWQSTGQPFSDQASDICYLRVVEEDDEYNRVRERKLNLIGKVSQEFYTRVWRVYWVLYGPKSFDRARMVRSGLFGEDFAYTLSGSNLYFVPDVAAPLRVPELFEGAWRERTDFSALFNEFVTETQPVGFVKSVEVFVEEARGQIADLKISKP